MRTVLMIARRFPPVSVGAGTFRAYKFAKYLLDFGWLPIVLTVQGKYNLPHGEPLLKEIPSQVQIFRTMSFKVFMLLPRIIRVSVLISQDVYDCIREKYPLAVIPRFVLFSFGVKRTLLHLLFMPDRENGWLFYAYIKAVKLIKQNAIKVIYSTSPPMTAHLVGLLIKKTCKVSWVADFRDPWVHRPQYETLPYWRRKIDIFLEKIVLKNADYVLSVSQPMIDSQVATHSSLSQEKFILIPNGYDEADFVCQKIDAPPKEFVITYTGTFFDERTPYYFFQAISELVRDNADFARNIKIIFVGMIEGIYHEMVEEFDIASLVSFVGHVSHSECIKYLLNTTILLFVLGKRKALSEAVVTSKIFEYIRSKKPILALSPEGSASEIIRKTRTGIVVDPDNVVEIKKGIMSLYENYYKKRNASFVPNSGEIRKYDRKNLTRMLAEIFDRSVH